MRATPPAATQAYSHAMGLSRLVGRASAGESRNNNNNTTHNGEQAARRDDVGGVETSTQRSA